MQVILSDHNCEGQADSIFNVLRFDGTWLELVPMELKWFSDFELDIKSNDERVWQFCQDEGFILLTGNRSADDQEDSLEFAIRRLVTPQSLPVLTIGNLKRVQTVPDYCEKCAERLAEIVSDLEIYRGITRLYLP